MGGLLWHLRRYKALQSYLPARGSVYVLCPLTDTRRSRSPRPRATSQVVTHTTHKISLGRGPAGPRPTPVIYIALTLYTLIIRHDRKVTHVIMTVTKTVTRWLAVRILNGHLLHAFSRRTMHDLTQSRSSFETVTPAFADANSTVVVCAVEGRSSASCRLVRASCAPDMAGVRCSVYVSMGAGSRSSRSVRSIERSSSSRGTRATVVVPAGEAPALSFALAESM